jgi:dihydrolipoamide dehydrogenase
MSEFDVIVIGSGPGGYVAAIKAAQLGLKTAIVEKDASFGGTCLNVGCIPTKVMIHSAEFFARMGSAADHGVVVDGFRFDMGRMHKRKDRIVTTLTKGVGFLLKKNGVTSFQGVGSFVDEHTVAVAKDGQAAETLRGRFIVIATGSEPKALPHIRFDGERILSSTDMLRLAEPPQTLAVIGAGAVGVEFASIYADLGSKVTLVEMLPHLLPLEDEEVSQELEKAFKKRKIAYLVQAAVQGVEARPDGAALSVKDAAGKVQEVVAEKVLLAVGRAPYTAGLGLEKIGLATERGCIPVNEFCQTRIPHIYAIGDVIPTPQLAHVGSAEGILAVSHLAGKHVRPIAYRSVPACTYSSPQVASTGWTEKKAREAGVEVKVGKFPFSAIGKGKIEDFTEGFIKIVTDAKTGEILGAHMIGAIATELVAETVLALNLECTAEELASTIHPHPTISEALMEAAHAAHDQAIHI